jgi:hypothetical protein
VLIQARDDQGRITNRSITRALSWLHENGNDLNVRVVNLSVAGDGVHPWAGNPVDEAVAALVDQNVVVTAALMIREYLKGV